jgi:hypothetical protein
MAVLFQDTNEPIFVEDSHRRCLIFYSFDLYIVIYNDDN